MIQGIKLATEAMTVQMQKQDQISNNLANMQTTGFKQSRLFIKSFEKYLATDTLDPYVNQDIKADEVCIDFSEGPLRKTGNDLDLTVRGSGFFTVMTPRGVRYTRNGNFSLNPDGFLVTVDGHKVMAKEGFIRIDRDGGAVRVNTNGEVLQDEKELGELRIADFKKPYTMLRDGDSFFKPQLPDNPVIESAGFEIRQGCLEGSNASPIQSMVAIINAFRIFEADQKALQAQDQTLEKAVNSVGRIG